VQGTLSQFWESNISVNLGIKKYIATNIPIMKKIGPIMSKASFPFGRLAFVEIGWIFPLCFIADEFDICLNVNIKPHIPIATKIKGIKANNMDFPDSFTKIDSDGFVGLK